MTIHDFFSNKDVDLPALASFLDGLDSGARVRAVRSLEVREQAVIFDAAAGFRPVRLNDLVPDGTPPLKEIVHHGRNSLPILARFQKRFCLPDTERDELWGYNEHFLKPLIGPGYFLVRQASEFEVMIDYAEVPPAKPEAWPPILPNSARLGRFVYQGLCDTIRGLSRQVTVGRATRKGRSGDSWFVLCRDDGRR